MRLRAQSQAPSVTMRCRYRLHLDLSYFNINLNVDCVTLQPGGHEGSWCDSVHTFARLLFQSQHAVK
jgi:hypothetical protein